jgi:hypothetical protein
VTWVERDELAQQMRQTARALDADHPVAGDHVRDAAELLELDSTAAAKRHLDAAIELLAPRNLYRHGILDDEGRAAADRCAQQVRRHRLGVQDIEDSVSALSDAVQEGLLA